MGTGSSKDTGIRYGIFDWIEWDKQPASQIFEERLRLLERADEAGFYCYHLAEHHLTPLSIAPSPALFLSAAAQRTKQIHLGPLVYLLPFYHPVRLLQEICMLDHLSQGRLELGVGRGIVPFEAQRFNINPEDGWAMFHESLDILLTGFTQGSLDYEGKYNTIKDTKLWLEPYQKPYPPLWYASNNIETVPWMAQHGFNTSHIFDTAQATRAHFDLYRQIWEQHKDAPDRLNRPVQDPILGLVRHIYVAPTDDQAVREAREAWNAWFNNINYLWAQAGSNFLSFVRDFDDLLSKGIIVAGSPHKVRDQVQQEIEESGINYFVGIFAWGDISHANAMRSMEYFVEEVMPTPDPTP